MASLLHNTDSEIAELAEYVSNQYSPNGRVNPEAIAREKGITLSFGRYGNFFDGMLEHKHGAFHIFCNLDRCGPKNSPRSRFTLSHELGHFFIDSHRNSLSLGLSPSHPSRSEYESQNPVEREADHFASNLLMPTGRFVQKASSRQPGLPGILSLADMFGTSVTSTAVRYATLNIRPCIVIKWNSSGYTWKWLSEDAYQAKYLATIRSNEEIPRDSPTGKALANETVPAAGYFTAGTTASAWFRSVRTGSYKDIVLLEQSIRLGRYGVLTLLMPESGNFVE